MTTNISHWTNQSTEDFLYRIASDYIEQLYTEMEKIGINQAQLAQTMKVSKGRISQLFNNPGNLKLESIVNLARALGLKVSIVAYGDNDPSNVHGPINAQIFSACWKLQGYPRDFWDMRRAITPAPTIRAVNAVTAVVRNGVYSIGRSAVNSADALRLHNPFGLDLSAANTHSGLSLAAISVRRQISLGA